MEPDGATLTATAAPTPNARHATWRRITAAPIGAHLAALTLVLLLVMAVIGTDTSFSSDEGAAIIQAKLLRSGQGWILPNAFPRIDPTGADSYVALSEHGELGTAPFAKHFTYPVVLSVLDRVGGAAAMVGLSIAGCVLAAWAASCIARRLDPRLERWALWATALGSPLLFDSQIVIAHTIGAALAGGVTLAILRARERWAVGWILLAWIGVFFAGLQRNEVALFAVVLGGLLLWEARARRQVRWVVAAVGIVGAAGAATLVDRAALGRIVGASVSAFVPITANSEFLAARVNSVASLTVLPGDSWPTVAIVGLLLMVLGVVAAALVTRSADYRSDVFRGACGLAVVGLVLSVAGGHPDTIPGLLVACPVVLAGLVLVRRGPLRPDPARFLAILAGGFAALVAVLQYNQAGAAEWGARFLALVLPILVPLALLMALRAGERLPAPDLRIGIATLVVLSLGVAGLATWSLRYYHGTNRYYLEVVDGASRDWTPTTPGPDGATTPVVITTWLGLGRLAWPSEVPVRGLTVDPVDLPRVLGELRADGVDRLTFVSNSPEEDLAAMGDAYQVVGSFPEGRADPGPVFRLQAR